MGEAVAIAGCDQCALSGHNLAQLPCHVSGYDPPEGGLPELLSTPDFCGLSGSYPANLSSQTTMNPATRSHHLSEYAAAIPELEYTNDISTSSQRRDRRNANSIMKPRTMNTLATKYRRMSQIMLEPEYWQLLSSVAKL